MTKQTDKYFGEIREILSIIQDKLSSLEMTVDKNNRQHSIKHGDLQKTVARVSGRMNNITPHKIEPELDSLRVTVNRLHEAYRLRVLQWATATEVERIVRLTSPSMLGLISSTIIRSFDESENWWWSKREYSLTAWIETFGKQMSLYSEKGKK